MVRRILRPFLAGVVLAALLPASPVAADDGSAVVPPSAPSPIAARIDPDAASSLTALRGRVLDGAPALVVPEHGLEPMLDADGEAIERWRIDEEATMVARIRAPLPFLSVRVHGNDAPIDLFWDGEPLPVLGVGKDGVATARVDAHGLEPGEHQLTLRVARGSEATIEGVAFRSTDWRQAIRATFHHRHRILADFALRGVATAGGREALGGFVFVGPRSETVDLADLVHPADGSGIDRAGRLVARVSNATPAPATFRIEAEDSAGEVHAARADLLAFEHRDLVLDLAAGTRFARLTVDGSPGGLFLWETPHLLPAARSPGAEDRSPTRPPVLLIVLDTVRRDAIAAHVSTGGRPSASTPHLDALAKRSTIYDAAHTTAPWTLPSHASLLTGLYPSRHGAGVRADRLDRAIPTLAERLGDAGWSSGSFVGAFFAGERFGLARGFGVHRRPAGAEAPAHEVTESALAFLRPRIDGPFFLLLNYFDAHFPYAPPVEAIDEDLARRLRDLHDAPGQELIRRLVDGERRAMFDLLSRETTIPEEAVDLLHDLYRAEITVIDEQVGRVLDALDDAGRLDETLVVVTSDHGELFGEGGYFFHSHRLDPELVEVPLLVKYPGQTEARRVRAPVSLVDVFATVLDVARLAPEPGIDGLSLRDLPAIEARDAVLAEEHELSIHHLVDGVKHADHAWAVSRLDRRATLWDGGALCSRREAPGTPWRASGCAGWIDVDRAIVESLPGPLLTHEPALDPRERERLVALGYLEP